MDNSFKYKTNVKVKVEQMEKEILKERTNNENMNIKSYARAISKD